MKNTSKKNEVQRLKEKLFLAGFVLSFGWALFLAITNLHASRVLPDLVANAPLIVGAAIMSIAYFYDAAMSRFGKLIVVTFFWVILFWVSRFIVTLMGINIHGLY